MNSPIIEQSLRRYALLAQSLIPQAVGLAICGKAGEAMQLLDLESNAQTQSLIDHLCDLHPRWVGTEGVRVYGIPGVGGSVVVARICDIQGEQIGAVAVATSAEPENLLQAPLLKAIAECIEHEMEQNSELDSMTHELTERYEELNLVYHTEDQVNYFREGQEALKNLTQNCLDYLDVGLALLILKEKGVTTSCYHPREPIADGQLVTSQLAGSLYQWVQNNKQTIVINDMSDALARSLLPGIPYRVLCCPIRDGSGEVIGILATVNHYSKTKFSNSDRNLLTVMARKAAKIIDANYDSLTGLINRSGYEHFLEAAFEQVKGTDVEKSLLHINIDQLHVINDTVGHAAGDAVIRTVATIMDSQKRDGDTLSRLGGDEFGVILHDCSLADAADFAERVCRQIEASTIELAGATHKTTVSIGVAMMSLATESVAQVMGIAEVACSVAKDQGQNRVEIYRSENTDMVRREEQMHLVADIQTALAEDGFLLYCQPIQALASGLGGHHTEVLLRVIGEHGEALSPYKFIPAAERYHLMPSIDRWVVSKALAMLSVFDEGSLCGGTYAINLSGQSLNETGFLEFVHQEIEKSGVPAKCICFEITETAAVANLAKAVKFIRSLKRIGCSFSLDDFGSGISSFGYLKSLPVDYLKIDGGIVKDIVTDETSAAMVAAINQVGHTMNLRTIAEFVENEEIRLLVQKIGVDYAQGYVFGKPAPFADRLRSLLMVPAAIAS